MVYCPFGRTGLTNLVDNTGYLLYISNLADTTCLPELFLIVITAWLIAQLGYHRGSDNPKLARAVMVLDLRGLLFFTLLYVLALSYRKITAYHMRFMIGTGLLMIGPGFGRALINSFGMSLWDSTTYTDYAAIFITMALLTYDILKKTL
jgi:hypothetical protein